MDGEGGRRGGEWMARNNRGRQSKQALSEVDIPASEAGPETHGRSHDVARYMCKRDSKAGETRVVVALYVQERGREEGVQLR